MRHRIQVLPDWIEDGGDGVVTIWPYKVFTYVFLPSSCLIFVRHFLIFPALLLARYYSLVRMGCLALCQKFRGHFMKEYKSGVSHRGNAHIHTYIVFLYIYINIYLLHPVAFWPHVGVPSWAYGSFMHHSHKGRHQRLGIWEKWE